VDADRRPSPGPIDVPLPRSYFFHAWYGFHGPTPRCKTPTNAQVSATISAATKDKLDRFTEQLGLKKNFVVEQALLFFMESRRELPDEAFIPTRLVLDDERFDELVARLQPHAAPTARLVELMRG
jgi:hypothetical protein